MILDCRYKTFHFVPISGYTGANMKDKVNPEVCSWFTGQSFMQTLDDLPSIERDPNAAVRIPITAKYKDMGATYVLGQSACAVWSVVAVVGWSVICFSVGRQARNGHAENW